MIEADAKIIQPKLNKITVGSVFTVELQTRSILDASAKRYNHQNCTPNKSPGNIITSFVINAKNSTVLALFQYSFLPITLMDSIAGICIMPMVSQGR